MDTSNWLPNRLILISPVCIDHTNWPAKSINLNITRNQVENSPSITEHLPVSRQNELALINYYGWPDYWQPLGVNIPESAILFTKKLALNRQVNKIKSYL